MEISDQAMQLLCDGGLPHERIDAVTDELANAGVCDKRVLVLNRRLHGLTITGDPDEVKAGMGSASALSWIAFRCSRAGLRRGRGGW